LSEAHHVDADGPVKPFNMQSSSRRPDDFLRALIRAFEPSEGRKFS